MAEYKITKKQKEYLESLVCQRVSDDEVNRELIKYFVNGQNSGIAAALKNGWNADQNDKLAFYIVKDPELNVPLLFFSLKCGEMHIPLDPEKQDKAVGSALVLLREAYLNGNSYFNPIPRYPYEVDEFQMRTPGTLYEAMQMPTEDWAKEVIAKQLVNGALPKKAWDKLWRRAFRAIDRANARKKDKRMDEHIHQTKKTYAAVELVHFCAYDPINWRLLKSDLSPEEKKEIQIQNNPVMKRWYKQGMGSQTLAKTMFWQFVVPIIQQIRKLVGCEYIYLFAADAKGDRDGKLIRYYKNLGFDFRDDLYVNKPAYDFCCFFMCQDVKSLRNKQRDFFGSYNKPKEPAAV